MLSNGRSKDNLHQGSTKIASGDLEIDGSLIVDNIQVNSLSIDGYTLPTSAGTNGQVITMNPDNTTTSFQDVSIPTLVDQRVCLNRWFSINQREKFGASQGTILFNENDVGSAVTGRRTIGTCVIPADDIDALDENFSILTLQIRNDILNSNPVDPNQIQFYLVLTTGGVTSSVQFEVMDYQGLVTGTGAPLQSMLEHQIRFARSINDASKILISVKGMKPTDTTGTGNTNTDKPFASHNNLKNGAVTGDIFIFDFPQQDNNTGVYLDNYVSGNDITIDIQAERPPVAGTNIINSALVMGRLDSYIKQNLPSSGPVINDHLLLSNLNGGTGDGGHINLFDVRGIKPMTGDLNLNNKSLTNGLGVNTQFLSATAQTETPLLVGSGAGALAITSNDLTLTETNLPGDEYLNINNLRIQTFKTLDMNSKEIQNVPVISNSGAPLVLFETTFNNAIILNRDPSNGIYLECINPAQNINLSAGGGSNSFQVRPTDVLLSSPLDMTTNDITNANVIVRASNGNVINFDNDIAPPLITGALTIESGAGKEININADNVLKLNGNSIIHNSGTGPHQFNDTGGLQAQFTSANIEMFKALDMKNNNINSVASLTATQVNTDTIENSGSGFLTFTNLGSYTPSFTPSALDMNLGNINNVDTIENTGSANITIPVVIGTPSGALQVKNGGAYIKQDLQVDGSIYCDSINNIRPSGGLYSESSGFNIPSTNLTETNLLGQGGSAGTLAIPANTFSQYDSYSFKASGVLSGGSNDTATLRLKSLVNGTTPVELGSIVIQLSDNGLVDVAWKVEADFNVRTLGGAGVGVLVLSGNFAYTNNNDVVKTYLRTIVNNTVFDTTQSNELQFTYQNDGTNPLTNIRIDQASFTKWY